MPKPQPPFEQQTVEDALKRNKPRGDKPVIGICFDWRPDPATGAYGYHKFAIQRYSECVEEAGGQPHLLFYTDKPEEFIPQLDGFLITGGADIHPRFYGEENNGSILADHADERFFFLKKIYEMLPRDMPVLGICLGFEFLNIMHGGTLHQDIPDKDDHHKLRRIAFKHGSLMHRIYGDTSFGACFHHQGLKKIGDKFEVTAVDDFSNMAHAIELQEPGRKVYGILFHPEITFKDEEWTQNDDHARLIFRHHVNDALEFKRVNEMN